MDKSIKYGMVVISLCLGFSTLSAQEISKKCTIAGSWSTAAKSGGKTNWKVKVTWKNGENNDAYGFSILSDGPQKDQFGDFTLTGSCSEGFCDFQQTYTAGKFKGRVYSYNAGYEKLNPLKLKGNYERLEGDKKISEGRFTTDKMTCAK